MPDMQLTIDGGEVPMADTRKGPNRAAKGAKFERLTAQLYEMDGWVTMRSAASKGPVDVLAMRAGDTPRFIQVKSGARHRGPYADFRGRERLALIAYAARAGAEAVLYWWPNGSGQPEVYWSDDWPVGREHGRPDFVVDDNGCWIWAKHINRKGYGQLNRDGANYAHRWYYEAKHGPIPEGLVLDHLCRVRPCVNPDHMEPVTNEENIARGALRKLTDGQVREILASPEGNVEIAARFGVSRSYVWSLRNGRSRGQL